MCRHTASLSSEKALVFLGIANLIIGMVLAAHYIACGWYAITFAGDGENWREKYIDSSHSPYYAYTCALHWALSMFTPAGVEIGPQNTQERIYTCFIIVAALVCFSSFVGSVTRGITQLRDSYSQQQNLLRKLRKLSSDYCLSTETTNSIFHFLKCTGAFRRKRLRPSDVPELQVLPKTIVEDLWTEAYTPVISVHPLFAYYSKVEQDGMRMLCNIAVENNYLVAFEVLYRQYHPVSNMVFVVRGSLEYQHGEENVGDCVVFPGQWACEETLWSNESFVFAPLAAQHSGCEFLAIKPEEFRMIGRKFKETARMIARYAGAFVAAFNEASHNPHETNLLYNDRSDVLDTIDVVTGFIRLFPMRARKFASD